jgi:hypothetical protein
MRPLEANRHRLSLSSLTVAHTERSYRKWLRLKTCDRTIASPSIGASTITLGVMVLLGMGLPGCDRPGQGQIVPRLHLGHQLNAHQ